MSENTRDIRAVLFDLDDTLYDRGATFKRWAERFAAEKLGVAADSVSHTEIVDWLITRDESGYGDKLAMFGEIRRRYPHVEDTVDQLLDGFITSLVEAMLPDEDAQLLLQRLSAEGVPFGIITNGSHRQCEKIRRLGLDHLTDCIFISGTFGVKKPHPSIFLAAATQLGFAPEHILFVGDHQENDVIGARRVGMRTAWLCQGSTWPATRNEHAPDWCLTTLADLLPILFNTS